MIIHDVQFQCRSCGRFVAMDSIESEDYLDPNAYYGIGTREWG